jgi:Endonuclease NucS
MPVELGLWRVDAKLQKVELGGFDLEERLEEILNADISMVSPNWMVVGRQVRTASDKFVDLLCMDRDGNLIVVELKRKAMEREIIAQVLDYGSWVNTLKEEEIVRIFDAYRKKYFSSQSALSIDRAFCTYFNVKEMPEELNEGHELVIVGAEFSASTERIVNYLASTHKVRINAVFFRVFKDGDREYIARVWLRDPTAIDSTEAADANEATEWNGEYYVSFGHEPTHRNWEDATKYGFISAGGGSWYSNTLHMLTPGARVWANVPGGVGYVGVGTVIEPVVKVDKFMVDDDNKHQIPIIKASLRGSEIGKHCDDPEKSEYLVRVKWTKTVPLDKAIKEKGFFGNQNTVAKPTAPKWNYTVQRLKERFGVS